MRPAVVSRMRQTLPMACSPGHRCPSCSHATSVDTDAVRVSTRPWPASTSGWDVASVSAGRQGTGVIVVRRALVPLQRQSVVAALPDDLGGNRALAFDCVSHHGGALQGQHRQQLGHGGDLVGLSSRRNLRQPQALLAAPSADQGPRRPAARTVKRTAQDLAINGDNTLALPREP